MKTMNTMTTVMEVQKTMIQNQASLLKMMTEMHQSQIKMAFDYMRPFFAPPYTAKFDIPIVDYRDSPFYKLFVKTSSSKN